MVTYLFDSKEDLAKRDTIQSLVDAGELPVMTTITKRPADLQCWQGVYYGGQWYPPSDPRGAELDRMRYMLPAGEIKEQKAVPLMLGEVEIQAKGHEFYVPHITVMHSASGKCLLVHFNAHGRIGKQKNHYPLNAWLRGDTLDLSTGGAKKCTISLAEWQAFIDQVEVRVSAVSKTTVCLTPELIKMARDVKAYRRRAPTDAEWAAETMGDLMEDEGVLAIVGAVVASINQEIEARKTVEPAQLNAAMTDLLVRFEHFVRRETDPGAEQAFRDAERHFRKLHNRAYRPPQPQKQRVFPGHADAARLMPKYRYSVTLANYVPTPRVIVHQPLADELAIAEQLDEFSAVLRAAKDGVKAPQRPPEPRSAPKPFAPTKQPSAAERACRRLSESKGHWDAMYQAQQRWLDATRAATLRRNEQLQRDAPKPAPVLPQLLQSKEDILERIAMNNVKPHPDRLSELCEACAYGVEHYADEEARTIFDGFYLQKNEMGTRILLRHRDHPNHVAVGETDIVTGAMVYAGERPIIREYMAKAVAGMAPSTNGKLPGVLVQQPIPEDAKQPPLRSGNNQHAEIVPDELPLFADAGEPESAA